MTTEDVKSQPSEGQDPKAKFREALEKKKHGNSRQENRVHGGRKISGGQSGGNSPRIFRRKSGSA